MRSPTEIKRLERKILEDRICKLYASIPKEPVTAYEFGLEDAIRFDIKYAKKELRELTEL